MSIRDKARRFANRGLYVPPGHYYSPIPSPRDVARALEAGPPIGVDLRETEQRQLAHKLAPLMADLPTGKDRAWRWHDGPDNRMFRRADAGLYYAMIADRKPAQVLEVGSGFSSAVALDAADRHSPKTRFTFVEPYPDRLLELLSDTDQAKVTLVRSDVQDLPVGLFSALEAGDVLFIDSTHVGKAGSDVLFLLFDVLPRLAPGVLVHVHDIFWPFTYPKRWLEEGRAWNEAYLLRAMLTEPSALRILAWGSWLAHHGLPEFKDAGSIWLERV